MILSGAVERVRQKGELTRAEARAVFAGILAGGFDADLLAELLRGLAARGETSAEIAGGADALREAMVVFEHPYPDAIDTCGTGGDGVGSFNLSTAAAVVAAAAGAHVVKHGNKSQSSRCGSADLLEAAGIPLALDLDRSRGVLERAGITFLFAPAHHPALRHAAPVRKALGVRTIFNFLGPLANPGRVRRQLVGVPEARRVDEIAEALEELGHASALVVHGAGGADELTLAGENRVRGVGLAVSDRFDARELGLTAAPLDRLRGGDATENLRLLRLVLDGEAGPIPDAVILNASAALVVAGIATDAVDGAERARDALASGRARRTMTTWVDLAREARVA
jgi:anthranilate phosphoribosyltransferase